MPLLGFSMGSSGIGGTEKSLDEIIADRRKEQAKASTGRNTKNKNNNENNKDSSNKNNSKKNATADRSIATGRAKRAASTRARRGLSNDQKPSPMEVEREVYRQSRKTSDTKKKTEQKASNGRLPPNSSLRGKKNVNKNNNSDPPGATLGRMPSKKQIEAAIQGMKNAGYPVPAGHQLIMQFAPLIVAAAPAAIGKGKGKQRGSGGGGRVGGGGQANNNNNNNNNSNNKKNAGGRGGRGGRK